MLPVIDVVKSGRATIEKLDPEIILSSAGQIPVDENVIFVTVALPGRKDDALEVGAKT